MILVAVSLEDRTKTSLVEVEDRPVMIGRKPEANGGEPADLLRIHWSDRVISRNHGTAKREGDTLIVSRLPARPDRSSPNAFYSNDPSGQRKALEEPLRLKAGDSFTIGSHGRTAFFWLKSRDDLDSALFLYGEKRAQQTLKSGVRQIAEYDAVEQLDEYSLRLQLKLLQRELPEQVLTGWTTESELFTKAAAFLEKALPGQRGVSAAFLALETVGDAVEYEILNPDPRMRADFRPSRTLLSELTLDHPTASDIHFWTSQDDETVFAAQSLRNQIDWVAVIPISSLEENATIYRDGRGRVVFLYVETRQATSSSAASFIPFLRLIAALVASLISAREKQRAQDQMSAYFSPALRAMLKEGDQAALEPSMAECTVLFCDRRASSKVIERARSDEEILSRLRENQDIVGDITQTVFDFDGVITDFAGDGVLALWGWPANLEGSRQHANRAVAAAEAIAAKLATRIQQGRSAVRVGISTGRIAVGKTGPAQQMHISVFGAVVNFGARLESLAKQFGVPVLLSEESVRRIRNQKRLLRKLCYMKPAGFENIYPIYELVLPASQGGSGASPDDVVVYEQALSFFVQKKWQKCRDLLERLPPRDGPSQWLATQADLFSQSPPPDPWHGEIPSFAK